jgi:hypothetical protein
VPFTCWWKSIGNYWYSFQRSGTRNRAEHRLDSSRLFFFLHFLRIVDSGASTQNSVGKPKDSICESLRVPPEKVVERCGAHRDQATLKLLWRNLEGTLKIYWIVFTCGSLEVFRQKEYGAVSKTSMKAEQALFILYDHNGSLCAVNFAMSSPELARTSFAEISPAFASAMRSRVWTGFSHGSN